MKRFVQYNKVWKIGIRRGTTCRAPTIVGLRDSTCSDDLPDVLQYAHPFSMSSHCHGWYVHSAITCC
jgi:hypothetical protein